MANRKIETSSSSAPEGRTLSPVGLGTRAFTLDHKRPAPHVYPIQLGQIPEREACRTSRVTAAFFLSQENGLSQVLNHVFKV